MEKLKIRFMIILLEDLMDRNKNYNGTYDPKFDLWNEARELIETLKLKLEEE